MAMIGGGILWATQMPVHGHFWSALAGPFFVTGAGTAFAFIPVSIGGLAGVAVVPGLLQTERYARAILSTGVGATEDEIEELVAARMERQRILERDHPPELWVILDEGVLRRPVGGSDVMREQLIHLGEMARRPHVVVQVIPLGAGGHQGLNGGAFVVADFEDAATIAYQDTAVSGQIIEDASEADALAHTWDTLRLEALPRAASLSLIEEAATQWT
jgi:Domain of unknown function (DUF5753)